MRSARFRESIREGRDQGWSKTSRKWARTDERTDEYFGAGWPDIVGENLARLPGTVPLEPWRSGNLRPWDADSIYSARGCTTTQGLFLERRDELDRKRSGNFPEGDKVDAPVFLDVAVDPATEMVRVLYWFFYELNWFGPILTHEGDWEHISLIGEAESVRCDREPDYAYFAQHNEGQLVGFTALDRSDGTHPVVYVNRHGHPTDPRVDNPSDYRFRWKTWESDLRVLVEEPFRDFAGAWGEVGITRDTTGPLGPLFKRNRDQVRVAVDANGRLCVKLKRK